MQKVLNEINKIIQYQRDGKTRGLPIINCDTPFDEAMGIISKAWENLNKDNKNKISTILLDKPNYLIGNEKWALYNYICDLDTEIVHIRAGKYAYYKIKPMLTRTLIRNDEYKEEYFHGTLNGEDVCLYCNHYIDKKEIVMTSQENLDIIHDEINMHRLTELFPGDLVLYYA